MVHSHSNLLACASICRSLVWTTTSVRLVPCKVKKGGHVEWFVQVWWTITQCGLRIVLSPDPTPSYYWSRSGNVSWHLKVVWNVPVREQVTKWLLSRSWAEPVARHSSWRLLENVVQLNKSRMLLNIQMLCSECQEFELQIPDALWWLETRLTSSQVWVGRW